MKTCTKCKIEKDFSEFRWRTSKKQNPYWNSECKLCEKEREKLRVRSPTQIARKRETTKIWVNNNKEYVLEQKRIQSKERRKKDPTYHKRWREKNREKTSISSRNTSKFARENLLDYYIVGYLVQSTGMTTEQIRSEPELIRLTKNIILIKRKIENEQSNELSAIS
jgi:hypothetical protein